MDSSTHNTIVNEVATYYSEKIKIHGETARGVDWNGEESQFLRFEQLCKILPEGREEFSLMDLGCGYGALLDFLDSQYSMNTYLGVDISEDMIQAAKSRHKMKANVYFSISASPDITVDYGMASGIFNVRLNRTDTEWLEYLKSTLDLLDTICHHGFAFNCLTSYSDEDKKRDYLYYADPSSLFDFCKKRYSRHVSLLHDYGLYEFTILVRKTL